MQETMMQETWTAVDQYINGLLAPADEALAAAQNAMDAAGMPAWSVSASQGKLLCLLARMLGARKILEVGTLGGYSTIWLARALAPDGRLITLEADAKYADVARRNIAFAGLSHLVDLRLGSAQDTLPKLAAERQGPFDLIFIDADKAHNPLFFDWALKLSRRGSLIIVDNVVREGKVLNASSADKDIQGIRRFNEILAAEQRVSATEIQTVGSKGYDGFAFILVTGDGRPSVQNHG